MRPWDSSVRRAGSRIRSRPEPDPRGLVEAGGNSGLPGCGALRSCPPASEVGVVGVWAWWAWSPRGRGARRRGRGNQRDGRRRGLGRGLLASAPRPRPRRTGDEERRDQGDVVNARRSCALPETPGLGGTAPHAPLLVVRTGASQLAQVRPGAGDGVEPSSAEPPARMRIAALTGRGRRIGQQRARHWPDSSPAAPGAVQAARRARFPGRGRRRSSSLHLPVVAGEGRARAELAHVRGDGLPAAILTISSG